ncbi:MAG: HAD family hydrolase [Candidatus Hermodarchaeota archaeon]
MIKNIIFDLGNVLLSFKPEQFLMNFIKDKNRIIKFIANVIQTDTWLQLDRGNISLKNAQRHFISTYPEEKELIILFFNHWQEMLIPIQTNIDLVKELKSNGYKLYVLSNIMIEAFDFVKKRYNFFSLFDGIVISGNIQIIKPEMGIYQHLLQKYNLNPEESVFIDDVEQFTLQADNMNMKTIHYLPTTDLRSELRRLDVKI